MIRHFALACAAVFCLVTTVNAQEPAGPQDAELSQLVKESLAGDWVRISEQTPEEVTSSISAFCHARMFVPGDLTLDWKFDADTYATVSPVLGGAKGNLAFRFNGPDDLFVAQTPKTLFSGENIEVLRATELRMDMNGDRVGIRYGRATELSPAVETPEPVKWLRYSLITQRMENRNTGETFLFASFPMGPNYEAEKSTRQYVKCP